MRSSRSMHALVLVLTAAFASAAGAQLPDSAESQATGAHVQAPSAPDASNEADPGSSQAAPTQAGPAQTAQAKAVSNPAATPVSSTTDASASAHANSTDASPDITASADAEGSPGSESAVEAAKKAAPAVRTSDEAPSPPATPAASDAGDRGTDSSSQPIETGKAAVGSSRDRTPPHEPPAAAGGESNSDAEPAGPTAASKTKPTDEAKPTETLASTDAAPSKATAPDSAKTVQSPPSQAPGPSTETKAQTPQTSAVPVAVEPPAPPPHPELAVATGGGAFTQAYQQAVIAPFASRTGVNVTAAGSEVDSSDVVILDASELAHRCNAGELASLEIAALKPRAATPETDLQEDFLQGALKPCGIAALAWSNLFVYDPNSFEKRAPQSVSDVFDTRRFPGKRALPKDGRGLVEAILVADGVPADAVYRVLETSNGINRILKTLKRLGTNIIWYDQLSQAVALLRSGEAAIAFTSNGHAFTEQARSGPLGLIWDGQVLHASYFAIPKTASEPEHAKELIAFSANPTQLTGIVRQIPYGPMRRSAVAGAVGMRHMVTGQELGPFLPTAPDNMRTAVLFDPIWWEANGARMAGALRIARIGPPLPTRP